MSTLPCDKKQSLTSSKLLLADLECAKDIVYLRSYGNIGDRLINAGARRLLSRFCYREVDIRKGDQFKGEIGIVAGGGGWCKSWHDMPSLVNALESRYSQLIVWPSSFDVLEPAVLKWLMTTKAKIYTRERESFRQIANYVSPTMTADTAFFFDYTPYQRKGVGTLSAFRTDRERRDFSLPKDNFDISVECADLDHWLHTIASHRVVRTDRAHVMIAAAFLGKEVHYSESNYHKVRGIAEMLSSSFPVTYAPI